MRLMTRMQRADEPADPRRRVFLVVGALLAALLIFLPARSLVAERNRIDRLEQRLSALRSENEVLRDEVDRLNRPGDLELLARDRLGLVRPGEQAYLFVPEPSPSPAPAQTQGRSAWSRFWSRVGE